jgi:hypothetical protein
MTVPFDRKLAVSPDTLINFIDGESVILNLKSESYFGLDEVGTRMWEVLTTSDSIQAAYQQLLDEYEVEAEELKSDLGDLVENLLSLGLIELA